MFKKVCDRCKTESIAVNSDYELKEWKQITYSVGYNRHVGYDVCPDCLESLGLNIKDYEEQEKTIADRLFEIIEEIVSDTLPNNQ